MAFFGDIAGQVLGRAVGSIFGGGDKGEPQRDLSYKTPPPAATEPTSLLARSVMSGRQSLQSPSNVQGGYKGLSRSMGGKGLKSATLISDEARFWGALYNRAINESQKTLPTSIKEQHGQFKR